MIIKSLFWLCLLCSFGVHAAQTSNKTINLNSADLTTLQTLKGIGPKKATAIIEYRSHKSSFHSVDDLLKIKGFTKHSLDQLKKYNPDKIILVTEEAKAETR